MNELHPLEAALLDLFARGPSGRMPLFLNLLVHVPVELTQITAFSKPA